MSDAEPIPPRSRLLRFVFAEVDGPRSRQGMPPRLALAAEVHIPHVFPPPALFRPPVKALGHDM